jgi:hypothetical protein
LAYFLLAKYHMDEYTIFLVFFDTNCDSSPRLPDMVCKTKRRELNAVRSISECAVATCHLEAVIYIYL